MSSYLSNSARTSNLNHGIVKFYSSLILLASLHDWAWIEICMNQGLLELSREQNVYLNAVDGAGSTVLYFILMRMMVHHDADNLDWYRRLLAPNIHFETTRDPFAACTLAPASLVRQNS